MLLSRLDSFGLPLCEGTEIEVRFTHKGRPAKAVFDVWAQIECGDIIDGEADLVAAEYEDTEDSIDLQELSKKSGELEADAFDHYLDMKTKGELDESIQESESDVIRSYLDKARKQIKMAIDHVRSMEGSHDPKSHAGAKIRGSKHALIEVERVLVSALAKAEGMLDKIKRL